MNNIIQILKEIKNTSNTNDKFEILLKNQDNKKLQEVFEFLYNPFILTGISNKKIIKKIKEQNNNDCIFENLNDLMVYLKNNNTGRDIDILRVQNYINSIVEYSHREFIIGLVTKSLKIGVTAKSLNKIFGKNFIPEFNVMLAESYFKNEHKVNNQFIITEKLDGSRAILVKENDIVKLFSRQGQPLIGFTEIEEDAKSLPNNIVLDGEFILKNSDGLNSADLFRATMKVIRKDGSKTNIVFHAFDILPLEDFKNGICKISCMDRKMKLSKIINENFININAVPILYVGIDKEEINQWLKRMIEKGKEGIMINLADSPYRCKRCSDILKVKKMHTVDLKIIGFEEGEGKYKGTLGRINVEYKGHIVGVGSGFKDDDREYIWDNQNKLINRIVEIQYFEESSNQNGGISLRFPVFKCIRENGKGVSYN